MARITGIDSGQPLDSGGEMIVGGGPVHDPPAGAHTVTRGIAKSAVVLRQVGVFDANEVELGGAHGDRGSFVLGFPEPPPLRQPRGGD